MKRNLTCLLFLIVGISFTSCKKVEEVTNITYRYVNYSGHELELSVYRGDIVRIETLQDSASFDIFRTGEGVVPAPIDGDSAYVLFKNRDKYLIFLAMEDDGVPQGIFSYQAFDSRLVSDNDETKTYLYTFTFTPQDYSNAKPL